MKKKYSALSYEITLFNCDLDSIVTLSSDRENAYVPSDSIWNDFEFDDDD